MIQDSQQLTTLIQNHIKTQGGMIRFEDYMKLALYTPGIGYYSSMQPKFGREGDFVTAPEIGSSFAKCLAEQCRQILQALPYKNILEIGAGSGQLAADLIKELGPDLDQYYILEVSAALQQRQATKAPTAQWLYNLPENFTGIIIANEVMDAMPVARFHFDQNNLQEYFVTRDLAYALAPASKRLTEYFSKAQLGNFITDNYASEVNLWIPGWIKSLHDCMQQGAVLLFDYGFPRAEFYHPQRSTGTLMCHYQHRSHTDPFYLPGQQDITAHVDFTTVAEAAQESGLEINGFTHLAGFLLNSGIAATTIADFRKVAEMNMLTSPAEMGELFKAIGLTKNMDIELLAFTNFDRTHTL